MSEPTTPTRPSTSLSSVTYEPYGPPDPDARVPEPQRPVPPSYDAARSDRAQPRRRFNLAHFVLQKFGIVNVICVSIWAMTGFGYFWPMWVMLGTGIPTLLGVSTLGAVSAGNPCGGRRH